jgi:hypothetical protein
LTLTCFTLLASSWAGASALTEADLSAPGDGLITRDVDTGLDWLDVSATSGVSYASISTGGGGWSALGFRHATASEVCALLGAHAVVPASGCPTGNVAVTDRFTSALHDRVESFVALLGMTTCPSGCAAVDVDLREVEGWFDDELGTTSAGRVTLFHTIAGNQTSVGVRSAVASKSFSAPRYGNWLVRETASQPVVATAPCVNNPIRTCAAGISGLVIGEATFNVVFEINSYNAVFAGQPAFFIGDENGAIQAALAIATVLNGSGIVGVIGDSSEDHILVPYYFAHDGTYPTETVISRMASNLSTDSWGNVATFNVASVFDLNIQAPHYLAYAVITPSTDLSFELDAELGSQFDIVPGLAIFRTPLDTSQSVSVSNGDVINVHVTFKNNKGLLIRNNSTLVNSGGEIFGLEFPKSGLPGNSGVTTTTITDAEGDLLINSCTQSNSSSGQIAPQCTANFTDSSFVLTGISFAYTVTSGLPSPTEFPSIRLAVTVGSPVEVVNLDADVDNDGISDDDDLCPGTGSGSTVDPTGCADTQVDSDNDGYCNATAPSDGPSGCIGTDNCPVTANPDQADTNNDGVGNACDELTPTGSGVGVNPVVTLPDGTSTTTVEMTFETVEAAGATNITTASTPTGGAPGSAPGFKIGTPPVYYDVTTTAEFSGFVTLCFSWQEGQFNNENNVKLFHFEVGAWKNVTTSLNTAANKVCGAVTSLSPFALFESSFAGFFAPVDNPPIRNTVKAGSGVPVKFSLGGDHGLAIFASGYPLSQAIACDSGIPSDSIEETIAAGASGISYDASSDVYTYVWKTDKAWGKTCRRLIVRLTSGLEQTAEFAYSK